MEGLRFQEAVEVQEVSVREVGQPYVVRLLELMTQCLDLLRAGEILQVLDLAQEMSDLNERALVDPELRAVDGEAITKKSLAIQDYFYTRNIPFTLVVCASQAK